MAPFPWLPMIAISGALVTHGFCLSSLYPYLGYMVRQLGATDDKDAVGEYDCIRLSQLEVLDDI